MSKSSKLWAHGASAGLVVNNEDSLRTQRGKADDLTVPRGHHRKTGLLIHLTTLREHQRGDYGGSEE